MDAPALKNLINRYATPLTTGFFLVSMISGVALFFHWAPALFHGMHEWLSMVLLVPFVLHLWKNWGPLMGYFKRKTMFVPLLLSLLVAMPFAIPNSGGKPGGNPAFAAVQLVTKAPLTDSAALFKNTPDELVTRLRQRGLAVTSSSDSLNQVAQSAKMQPAQLIAELLNERQ
ncbi:DUF4405 domain-containing protein [Pseudomonas sp. PB120]|uniref:DUF4405 domain-containing protein n=1 Tax=Pseudomonas sp. PB120 TaxID=2494700 RepID=UPI0012FE680F|nr:DUF4405 domain-containing protein [Pseudomonas sp. PB120]MVV51780.1 DUF4405 domain-containing protein [Pseudomonas sp. PB120]